MEPHEFSELEKVEATDGAGEASTSRPASGDSELLQACIHSMSLNVGSPYPQKASHPHVAQSASSPKGQPESPAIQSVRLKRILLEVYKLLCRKVHAPEAGVDSAVTVVIPVCNLQQSLSQLSCWALAS